MKDKNEKISELFEKLQQVLKKQDDFSKEISFLRFELHKLKSSVDDEVVGLDENIHSTTEPTIDANEIKNDISEPKVVNEKTESVAITVAPIEPKGKSDLEKFIGENLINKIGIAITIIGVAIGAKYSIENDLISPLTRIILGYLCGLGLLGFGIKLKSNYENYSAVLVSGAIAIFYFITYTAYALYQLFPQVIAFALMVIFTVFTVIASINYNRQIIAHIGLVGAYAVPFLLSEGNGKVAVLFAYMAIINIGILAIAFKKYWKPLYFVSFGLTWMIFLSWFIFSYKSHLHFEVAFIFVAIFFAIFYLAFLGYKLIQKEKFVADDIILLMANSFIFYGIGYTVLDGNTSGQQLLGLFTLVNGLIHFVVSFIIYRQKLSDKNIQYLITGFVLIFITISVPVQLDGNWVTLFWAGEAALLFWIGRTKAVSFYEVLSYCLMLIAFLSILHDWSTVYNSYAATISKTRISPIINVNFLSSILFIVAFAFIYWLNKHKKYPIYLESLKGFSRVMSIFIATILLVTIYLALRMEIVNYWNQLHLDSVIKVNRADEVYPDYYWNPVLKWFKSIWVINYSLLFVTIMTFAAIKIVKNKLFGIISLLLSLTVLLVFLFLSLYQLSELRFVYLNQILSEYYHIGTINLWMRYISFGFVALNVYACFQLIKQDFNSRIYKMSFQLLVHTTVLWVSSSELINWLDICKFEQSYKLGLTILWGTYSLFLIALGIAKKNQPMRIGAMVLFGVTLIKLFFYDISHLNTIAKTIVFVSLGILLLIISFLYNKYKHFISDEHVDK